MDATETLSAQPNGANADQTSLFQTTSNVQRIPIVRVGDVKEGSLYSVEELVNPRGRTSSIAMTTFNVEVAFAKVEFAKEKTWLRCLHDALKTFTLSTVNLSVID